LNKPIKQSTIDGGITQFWYDRIGRLVVSQNAKQETDDLYSYTLYDDLGRINEVGQLKQNHVMITDTSINPIKLSLWIANGTEREQVTRTFYDEPITTIPDFSQDNLRNRVATVTFQEVYDTDEEVYNHASHYSYDIAGNVKSMVQDNQLLSTIVTDQRYKRLDYNYDLISGKVNEVRYQKGKADEWNHRYTYDADNRIKNVKTSTNYIIWDEDAKYFYYEHGPLARTELGQNKVQGIDYVYTLQGWLKGINSTTLDSNRDVGQDGYSSSANEQFAPDVYSYSLGYFANDYKPIDATNKWTTVASRFISNPAGSFMLTHRDDLHNGNISYMMTTITDPSDGSRLPQATAYRYDQLNRLLEERAFANINETQNKWNSSTGSYNNRYFNYFTYDGNGNIITQHRHNKTGEAIDSLAYKYYQNDDDETMQNRLYHVRDEVGDGVSADDIDDQGTFDNDPDDVKTNNNYSYTELGELKKDDQEEIASIVWRTDGKIKEIIRESTSSKKNLKFEYDPMGNRIAKHVLTSANVEESVTYYVRDAQGNIMSTYVKTAPGSILSYKVEERHLYGSSRLGIYGEQSEMIGATVSTTYFNHLLGKRSFEGVNHLGNVLTVFSDRKFPQNSGGDVSGFKAELFTSQDYYPFGMVMPGRSFSSDSYRYGFNGKETDNEVKGVGTQYDYGFRIYDPRLGKFLSVDPLSNSFPWYTPYQFAGNKPIAAVDLDGLEEWIVYNNTNADGVVTTHITHYTDLQGYSIDIDAKVHGKKDATNKTIMVINYDADGKRLPTGHQDVFTKGTAKTY
jgi:RHS repeat-associated protein